MSTTASPPQATDRPKPNAGAERSISRSTERPVPNWAARMAHAVPLLVLPSSVWRFPVAFGFDMGMVDPEAGPWVWWAFPYTLGLIAVTELLAYLTVGLVSRWGEVTPHWMPLIGGRRVRRLAAVIPATIGGVLLTALWAVEPILGAFGLFGLTTIEFRNGWWEAIGIVAYTPLALWGPVLLAVTASYARRRRPRPIRT